MTLSSYVHNPARISIQSKPQPAKTEDPRRNTPRPEVLLLEIPYLSLLTTTHGRSNRLPLAAPTKTLGVF
jgi:hypothetical protein